MHKKLFILAGILLSLFFVAPAFAQAPQEVIKSFDSRIIVNSDSSMQATETITVHSEGIEIVHGIYRDFPTKYKDSFGNNYNVGFELISVKRDGQNTTYDTEKRSNGIRIYIRDKNIVIPPGDYVFEITYNTTRQLGFFPDHDELYWNVTGNGWGFPIEHASAVVTLPGGVPIDQIKFDGYTGPQESRDKNFNVSTSTNQIFFATTKSLNSYEGLTIVVGWPKGFVIEPTQAEKTRLLLQDNVGLFFVFGGLLLVLLYFFIAWFRKGRDPRKGTIIPMYEASEGLSPAAMGYIYRMGYSNKNFTAAIINMAVKGYLKISKIKSTYHLNKTGANESKLSADELTIGQNLFGGGNEVILKNSNYQIVKGAIADLTRNLQKNYSGKYFSTNIKLLIIGCLIELLVFIVSSSFYPDLIMLFIIMYVIITLIFYRLLKKPTALGRKYMDEVEGFKWFLSVTEKDRMNFHNPPERTPELFEKFLPYAVALGVDNKWGQQFTNVFNQLHDQGRDYIPVWYVGANFSSTNFANSFGHSFSSAISSASTPPGSSSGFGGGFSGGGGGGGGGGGC